jgi:putative transposase
LRAILDAVFYVLKSGCPWRLLPREFPPWKTVYDWFRRWRIDGTWERLNAELRERLRCRLGREPNPSAGIVDSQSASATGVGGNERGFDPAKKVKGRKRRLLVDTEGLVLSKPKHTAPKFRTKMASGCCLTRRAIAFLAFRTCGSTRATGGGAEDGPRRFWG